MGYWLGVMRAWRRYFRYRVDGLHHLATHDCHLVVGYHGRPLAWDLFLLGAAIHREQGYLPLAVVHRYFLRDPFLRWLTEGLEWTTGRGPVLESAAKQGRHVILAPGGEGEGLRTAAVRYRVNWSDHHGYLRFALRRKLPVVPVAASGVDDAYHGLVSAETLAHSPLWRGESGWIGFGPLGLYPWSPPFPVHIHQIVGEPIDLEADGPVDVRDADQLGALHERIQARVQALLDRARASGAHCCRRNPIRNLLSP